MRHFAATKTCGNGHTATPPPVAGEVGDALVAGWGESVNLAVASTERPIPQIALKIKQNA